MKHFFYFVIICLSAAVTGSCGGNDNTAAEETLLAERDSLQALATTNQKELERMTSFFNEVAACIDSINEQESILVAEVDIETNRRYSQREIARRLSQLEEIITGQRERIASLVDSLNNRTDSTRTRGLRSTITFLTQQLEQKEVQINRLRAQLRGHQRDITNLREQVQGLTADVQNLTNQNDELHATLIVQTEVMNEGLLLIADKDRLKELGIVEGGGFLRRTSVNLGRVTPDLCQRVDIASLTSLPIPGRKVKILSPVPDGTYSLSRDGERTILTIHNPETFWSLSHTLVIQYQ